MKLSSEGWLLKPDTEGLTNVKYGDDILLFAKSREELQNMIVLLVEELRKIGLELNASKTKILTNQIGGTGIGTGTTDRARKGAVHKWTREEVKQ